ncbi:hypothetical protein Tco_0935479 [Tanacetum coccineum]
MLVMGRYTQWQSRFIGYVDTKAISVALRKCILKETFANMSAENRAHYDAKAEAIHLILTGIGDDIYSTVDACTIAKDMWFTSRDGESIESYYSRFYKMMNEMLGNQEVNEIRAEKIARNANPLALVAATQQYPDTKPKRAKDYNYHKEKMLLCKQAGKDVSLCAEQTEWLDDTDEELDEQELEVHYMYMAKIQEVHTADSGPSFDSSF